MQKTSKSSSCTLGPPILVPSTLPISEASYTTGQKTGIWKLGVLCCRFVDLLHPTSPVEAPAIRQDNTGFSRTGASSESKTWMWKCHFFGDLTGTCFDNVHYGISVSERLRETTKPNSCLWIWVHLSALNDLQAFFQLCPRRTRTEYRTAHWTWASLPSLQPQCRQQDSAQQRQEQNESTNLEKRTSLFDLKINLPWISDMAFFPVVFLIALCGSAVHEVKSVVWMVNWCNYSRIETRQSPPSSTLDCGHQCPWHLHLRFGVWLRRFLQAKMANRHKCRNIRV